MSNNELRLSVFDLDVSIQTDSIAYRDLLRKTYRHFQADPLSNDAQVPFNASFFTGNGGDNDRPHLSINGFERQYQNFKILRSEYAHNAIFSNLYSKVTSHFLLHAATLAYRQKGMIITADSGYGKTTLTLALVQRGFQFLSDEIAALGRKDRLIYPYPRGLHVRKETLDFLNLPLDLEKVTPWFEKYLVDIEDIFPGSIGSPVPISHVFVLKNEGNQNTTSSREFKAILSHTNPVFLQQIKDQPDVISVSETLEHGFPCLVIEATHRMKVIGFLENLCEQHDIVLIDQVKREEEVAEFAASVEIQKIPKTQAAMELLRRFLGGHHTDLLDPKHYQDSSRLLFELTSMLAQADCYQVTIGPLDETIEAISNIVCKEMERTI